MRRLLTLCARSWTDTVSGHHVVRSVVRRLGNVSLALLLVAGATVGVLAASIGTASASGGAGLSWDFPAGTPGGGATLTVVLSTPDEYPGVMDFWDDWGVFECSVSPDNGWEIGGGWQQWQYQCSSNTDLSDRAGGSEMVYFGMDPYDCGEFDCGLSGNDGFGVAQYTTSVWDWSATNGSTELYPGTVTIGCAVSPTDGGGTIYATINGVGTQTCGVNGSTTFTGLGVGSYSYQLSYGGDSAYAGSSWGPGYFTVDQSPYYAGGGTAPTFVAGSSGSYTIYFGGTPTPTISEAGSIPAGLGFYNNGDGTATITGTPSAGTGGSYGITVYGSNGEGSNAAVGVTITVDQAPTVTSARVDDLHDRISGQLHHPHGEWDEPNTLDLGVGLAPSGVTLHDNGNGTATLAGTPAGGTGGTWPITIVTSNGVSPNGSQSFTLSVDQAPAFTSGSSTTCTVGQSCSFTVQTTGYPSSSITWTGLLPTGVSFTDNHNGTATITGTPAAGAGGTYGLSISASNGVGSAATQGFTLTIDQAPAITSSSSSTFTVGTSGTFTATVAGGTFPAASFSETGTLPSGVTFSSAGVLSGTPSAGTGGTYAITIVAANGIGTNASQPFTLTIDQAAAITSATSTSFTAGSLGSFTVSASGYPGATFSETGALPSGVSLSTGGTLSGTPGAATEGTYTITITATNGVGTPATQSFTLSVVNAPTITSANASTFTVGSSGSFTMTTSSDTFPTASFSENGALPPGLSLSSSGVLSGTPQAGDGGASQVTVTAANGVGTPATQVFTITVDEAPTLTSANSLTLTTGQSGSLQLTASGYPVASFTESGALPSGVTLTSAGLLSGTPAAGTGGTYPITVSASNAIGSPATQAFVLTVDQPSAFTSSASTTFTVGQAGAFVARASGFPAPTFTETGSLPSGVTLTSGGLLSGTPVSGDGGVYLFTITASNGIGSNVTQSFTLTVDEAPTFTSSGNTTFSTASGGSFSLTASGYPSALVFNDERAAFGVTLGSNGTLSGTAGPATGGVYTVQVAATNVAGSTTQSLTLTVDEAPAISSVASTVFTAGTTGTFTVTTAAGTYPTPSIYKVGTLPSGVTLTDNGNGTATLSSNGSGAAGIYNVTITADNGVGTAATQAFSLTMGTVPAFTSPTSATETAGDATSIQLTASGFPAPTFSTTSALPAGLSLSSAGLLSGTINAGAAGTYRLSFAAANSSSTATETFVLTIAEPVNFTGQLGTEAGTGAPGAPTAGPALDSELDSPSAVAYDPSTGNVFVADTANNVIEERGPSGALSVVAGNGTRGFSGDGALATGAELDAPSGVAVGDGGLVVTDSANEVVRFLPFSNETAFGAAMTAGHLYVVAGEPGVPGSTGNGRLGTAATLDDPLGLAVAPDGDVAIADSANSEIRLLSMSTGALSLLAGDGISGYSGDGGASTAAELTTPSGLAYDSSGDLFIADVGSSTIREVAASNGAITTIAGTGTAGMTDNSGIASTAEVNRPTGIATDQSGDVFFSEAGTNDLRVIAGSTTTEFGLTMTVGHVYQLASGFSAVAGIASDAAGGALYVADAGADEVKVLGTVPAITNTSSATFTASDASSFSFSASGDPTSTWSESGNLPSGVTLSSSGVLSGTPALGTAAAYPITVRAYNGIGTAASQNFTLNVDQAPVISSTPSTTFTVGTAGSFTVTSAVGTSPAPTYSESGNLPSGLSLSAGGVLSGTPAAGTGGVYPVTLTANNGVAPNGTQSFTLTIDQAPVISSSASATFTAGTGGSFLVATTSGTYPAPSYSESGHLPGGVTFSSSGQLSGTPVAGAGGSYPIAITATNGVGSNYVQSFVLTVDEAPGITSSGSTTFIVGSAGSFQMTTSGYPGASFSTTATLPSGVSLSSGGLLSGTAAAGSGGLYSVPVAATNGIGQPATQAFSLAVDEAPGITSAASATFSAGSSSSFSFTTSGYPAASFSETGALPSGVTLSAAGVLSGTPGGSAGGTYPVTITAANGVGSSATQHFTLTVDEAPAISSAQSAVVTTGQADTVTIATPSSSWPTPALTESGSLPAGVTFTDDGNGTATIASSGSAADGIYAITITASNGVGTPATQSFSLTVGTTPSVTSAATTSVSAGASASIQLAASGYPMPSFSTSSPLPAGLSLSAGGLLSGTVATGAAGTYHLALAATNSSGTAPQSFTLTVAEPAGFNALEGTIAGTGTVGAPSSGPASASDLDAPEGVAYDTSSGNLYLADSANNAIEERTSNGTLSVVAGTGTPGFSGDGQLATTAELDAPRAVAVGDGGLVIADTANDVVRFLPFANETAFGTAMTGGHLYVIAGTPDSTATLDAPEGVAVAPSGDVAVSDTADHRVMLLSHATGSSSLLAGTGSAGSSGDGGAATAAELTNPTGLAYDGSGDLFVADGGASVIREIHALSGTISTIAGTGTAGMSGNGGSASAAELDDPTGVSVDAAGDVFLSDGGSGDVRFVAASSGSVFGLTVSAGDVYQLASGLSTAAGIAVDASGGATYVADAGANVVRVLGTSSAITSAASVTLRAGASGSFDASATGDPAPTWSESGPLPSGISLSSAGVLSGTPALGTAGSYPITLRAYDGLGAAASENVTLTVSSASTGLALTIGPSAPTVGESATATVAVTPVPDAGTTVAITDGDGVFDCPAAPVSPSSGLATCTGSVLTSVAADQIAAHFSGDTQYATSSTTLPLTPGRGTTNVVVTSSPSAPSALHTTTLTATVNGPSGPVDGGTVSFSDSAGYVSGCGSSTVGSNGTATCTTQTLAAPGTDTVSATYAGDTNYAPSSTSSSPLTIATAPVTVSISASPSSVDVGDAPLLTATVTGPSGPVNGGTIAFADTEGDVTPASSAAVPVSNGAATCQLQTVSAVTPDTVTAAYSGTTLYSSGLGTAGITPGQFATGLSVAGSSSMLVVGEPNQVTATIDTAGVSGTVAFSDTAGLVAGCSAVGVTPGPNGTSVASCPLGAASTTGTDHVIASYSGDTNHAPVTQVLALPIDSEPQITSAMSLTATTSQVFDTTIDTTGVPAVSSVSATTSVLPPGLAFHDNGNGTATVTGTVPAGHGGSYAVPVSLSDGLLAPVTPTVMVHVDDAPAFTTASSGSCTAGAPCTIAVAATGYPTPSFSASGGLPSGLNFVDDGNGSAEIIGTPDGSAVGTVAFPIIASNGVGSGATSSFTLSILPNPTAATPPVSGSSSTSSSTGSSTSATSTVSPTSSSSQSTPTSSQSTPSQSAVTSYSVTAAISGGTVASISCSAAPSAIHEGAKTGTLTSLGFSLNCLDGKNKATLAGSITSKTVAEKVTVNHKTTTKNTTVWLGGFLLSEPVKHLSVMLIPKSAGVNQNLVLSAVSSGTELLGGKAKTISVTLKLSPHFKKT